MILRITKTNGHTTVREADSFELTTLFGCVSVVERTKVHGAIRPGDGQKIEVFADRADMESHDLWFGITTEDH